MSSSSAPSPTPAPRASSDVAVILRPAVVAFSLVMGATAEASAATPLDPLDEQELRTMRDRNPNAAALLEQGRTLAASGALTAADAVYRRGQAEYPDGFLLFRFDCEALTELGRRKEGVEMCAGAIERLHSNTNVLALVRALVDGPTPPTTTELLQALSITAAERDKAPGGVAPAAAACIIAEKIGDGVMLQQCAEELERRDPDGPETHRALDSLSARCPPWRFWSGWLLVVMATLATLGHALWRRARGRTGRRLVATAVVLGTTLFALAGTARADEPTPAHPARAWLSKWPVDDANPDKSVPSDSDKNGDPLQFGYWLQDLALKAEQAEARGDHAAAAKFYHALTLAVPDRAVGFVKMCGQYEALGDRAKAIDACGDALLRDGLTVKDYTHFVHLVVAEPGRLSDKQTAALAAVLRHMREDPAGRDAVDDLECQVGVRTSNVPQLEECTAGLAARAPGDPRTLSYLWALAIDEDKLDEAAQLVEEARAAGMPPETLETMRQTTAARATRHRTVTLLAIAAIALLLGAAAVAARGILRRRLPQREPATST
jgi:hypothetical protein